MFSALFGFSRTHFVHQRVNSIYFTVYVDGSIKGNDITDTDIFQAIKYAQKAYIRSGIDINIQISGIFRYKDGIFPEQCNTTEPERDEGYNEGIQSDDQNRLQIDMLELLRVSRRKKECLQRLSRANHRLSRVSHRLSKVSHRLSRASHRLDPSDPSVFLVISSDKDYPVYGVSEQNGFQKGKAVIICFISPAETVTGLAATLAHELGHVLGAEHDTEQNSCKQGYIMEGSRAARKSKLFSTCSIKSIKRTLARISRT